MLRSLCIFRKTNDVGWWLPQSPSKWLLFLDLSDESSHSIEDPIGEVLGPWLHIYVSVCSLGPLPLIIPHLAHTWKAGILKLSQRFFHSGFARNSTFDFLKRSTEDNTIFKGHRATLSGSRSHCCRGERERERESESDAKSGYETKDKPASQHCTVLHTMCGITSKSDPPFSSPPRNTFLW